MRYLFDGNNLLHALGKLTVHSTRSALDSARRWLVLQAFKTHGADAIIVFDGVAAPREAKVGSGRPRVLYSGRHTADDLIEDLIGTDRVPRQLVVVSDDIRLREAARHRGCQSLRCLDYAEQHLMGERKQPKPKPVSAEKPEAGRLEDWADVFGHLDDDPRLGGPW